MKDVDDSIAMISGIVCCRLEMPWSADAREVIFRPEKALPIISGRCGPGVATYDQCRLKVAQRDFEHALAIFHLVHGRVSLAMPSCTYQCQ